MKLNVNIENNVVEEDQSHVKTNLGPRTPENKAQVIAQECHGTPRQTMHV